MIMNEQERLQRIIDILADSACSRCHCNRFNGDDRGPDHVDIQYIANDIMGIPQQQQKDTRSKREQVLDAQFACMGIKPKVYHFTENVEPFHAITIATKNETKQEMEKRLNVYLVFANVQKHNKATYVLLQLNNSKVYDASGVAICDKRDVFNKSRGRMIAKGRLMQHILEEEKK